MHITNDELVEEFYHTISKQDLPHISKSEVERICKSPFHFARYHMNRARLSTIRIKLFGTFFLYPNKILKLLETNDYNLKYGAITPETHQKAKQHLLDIYSEAISVREVGEWGRKLDIYDSRDEENNTNHESDL